MGRQDILSVCARDRNRKRDDIRSSFDANYKGEASDRYNIIITSDVLAEGVNLHRANIIVNYDSPWNATRLMQRIGRVNRIGSTSKAIHNYMFYPSEMGDAIISLKKNSLIKLQSFHSALGEDTRIYSHDEIVHEFHLFNTDKHDDTDRMLELFREVRKLHDSNPILYRRIKQLPCKSRCVRNADTNTLPQSPIYTITYLSSPRKKAFYLVGKHTRELSFLEAADIMRATPEEKAIPLDVCEKQHYEQVGEAMNQYTSQQQKSINENKPKIGSKDNDAKKAAAFLREVRPSLPDDDTRKAVDILKELVEQGKYNQLADNLNRLSRKHKKTPMPSMPSPKKRLLPRQVPVSLPI